MIANETTIHQRSKNKNVNNYNEHVTFTVFSNDLNHTIYKAIKTP